MLAVVLFLACSTSGDFALHLFDVYMRAVNLSAMNCQASRRTPKQLHRLASTNTPKMNKTNIPESIRFSQPGYRHAVSGRWRFLSTGGNPRPCLVRASVARGIMDGLRYTASWEPGFPFFGIVSPAAALYLSFRN